MHRLPAALLALVIALGTATAAAQDLKGVRELLSKGETQQAMALIDRAIAAKPNDPQPRFIKGVIFAETGRPDDAMAIFSLLIREYPGYAEPYNNIAVLYAARGEYDRARDALDMAIRANPDLATAHENLGDIYVRLAGESYGRAAKLEPANRTVQTKLSLARDLSAVTPKSRRATATAPAPPTESPATTTKE